MPGRQSPRYVTRIFPLTQNSLCMAQNYGIPLSLKALSKAVSKHTGKPESYVGEFYADLNLQLEYGTGGNI
jgi:hypothetical protein